MRRGFQLFLAVVGALAAVAGTVTLLTGASLVLGGEGTPPSVDSELRFHAVWYLLAGVVAIRAARRPEAETGTIRLLMAGAFLAGLGRALGWAVAGRPHALYVALMAIELVLPFVVLPWQAAVRRRSLDGANR